MYVFRVFLPWYILLRKLLHPRFIEDQVSQLADSLNADRFAMLLMAIDREQKIGDQTGQHLDDETMAASGNEMVHLEMPFPPGKKCFYVPA